MNTKVESNPGPLDTAKLFLAAVVLVGGIYAYNFYEDESLLLRAIGVLAALVLAIVIVFLTTQGRTLWAFIQGSRVEIRKVIWPTRQETMQTTLTVLVFTLILGVFFWLLDLVLLWGTKILTGQGG